MPREGAVSKTKLGIVSGWGSGFHTGVSTKNSRKQKLMKAIKKRKCKIQARYVSD